MAIETSSLKPGDVLTRAQIRPILGGDPFSGISLAADEGNVILFSDAKAGAKHGYVDGWLAEPDALGDVFEYTGAGKGDQTFSGSGGARNAAVLRHDEMKRTLHLFTAIGTVPDPKSNTKLHRYVGVFSLDSSQPYVVRQAPGSDGNLRKVIVFRLRPDTTRSQHLAEDQIPLAQETTAVLVPTDVTTASLVEPEQHLTKESERAAQPATIAQRKEAALCAAYEKHLTAQGHDVARFQITPKGKATTLITDLYDVTLHRLYEAKGTATRRDVRMALGQILDYSRFARTDNHPEPPERAVLLPHRPDDDLCDLLAEYKVAVVYRDPATDTFIDLSGHADG
jgi:5-methylcytosine-specific restriction protein A